MYNIGSAVLDEVDLQDETVLFNLYRNYGKET
jgi:hypothetical protein